MSQRIVVSSNGFDKNVGNSCIFDFANAQQIGALAVEHQPDDVGKIVNLGFERAFVPTIDRRVFQVGGQRRDIQVEQVLKIPERNVKRSDLFRRRIGRCGIGSVGNHVANRLP